MIEGTIAIRYARALMGLAKKEDRIDVLGQQLGWFVDCCKKERHLLAVLAEKGFDLGRRLSIVDSLASKIGLDVIIRNFLKLLIQKGRIQLLPMIYDKYVAMANKILGRLTMLVVSAVELPDKRYERLVKFFGEKLGKEMILKKRIDRAVLGGLRVQIGDKIYDDTLKRQLIDLKRKMVA